MSASDDARLKVLASLDDVERADWDACANPGWDSDRPFGDDASAFLKAINADAQPDGETSHASHEKTPYNPFVSYDFLSALEKSGSATARTGWQARHIVLEGPGGSTSGVVPCYQKAHSQGEYVFDQGWADAYERAGGSYYPKLQVSVPFTPATGPRLLVRPEAGFEARSTLAAGLVALTRQLGLSSVHATFLQDVDAEILEAAGFLARNDQQFHFENPGYRDFDDFLDALASRKRKTIRRERREALEGGIEVELLTGKDITESAWDAFFAFYMDTGSRKWGRPYLNRRFFSMVGETMADRILLVFAKRGGRPIAGALNFIGSDALYGRYWGATEEVPFLHFEICYHQAVDWGIAHRLPRIEAGAQGEHKLARGYKPIVTRSAHWIADKGFRRAVADYLEREREAVAAEHEILDEHTPFKAETPSE
ncbi:GNAT family N-acetyltransferase [Kaistia dalseonensis]|uniref:N-acyltransferase n=1 Tax=Kaistia dalseonensis TaxID=410840 RepID=A0ABU0H3F3_9HYPH|nr:GNAT family N-acetyltransferase [Kaistia dalseonensis]MCX5494243.1 GNAT family N-acetyltransferase [Kaistia dalseonensis]MDQ0436823.1 putative N-acyltransferase [Kaistia dalseonensis]